MLDSDELKKRIDAARTLRGLRQVDLAKKLHEDGLGKHDLGRLERGDLTLQATHLNALAKHLQVPEAWFTDHDLDLTTPTAVIDPSGVDTLAEKVEAMTRRFDEIQDYFRGVFQGVRDDRVKLSDHFTRRLDQIAASIDANQQLLENVQGLEMEWRNSSRSITSTLVDLAGTDAQDETTESGTPKPSDATPGSDQARREGTG